MALSNEEVRDWERNCLVFLLLSCSQSGSEIKGSSSMGLNGQSFITGSRSTNIWTSSQSSTN
jgi:hypothetical protein